MIIEKEKRVTKASDNEKVYAMFIHLSAIIFGIIGPLLLWVIKKDSSRFIHRHGRYALNFQLSMIIYSIVTFLLCFVFIGFFLLLPLLPLVNLIFSFIAALKAANGEAYKYPLCLRIIR